MSTPSPVPREQSVGLMTLLSLAWPVIIARATQSVIGFTDALLSAPLGEDALAAVTTGALNTVAFIVLPMGTAFIVQSFAAQLRGRGDYEAVDRYAFYGLALAGLATLFSLACIPFTPWLLSFFGYDANVHALMTEYLTIRLLSVGAAVGIEALGNWYGGLGNTRPAMHAGVVAMVVNVAGDYLLIEPRLGLPGYGVAGAAWASTFSTLAGFLVIGTQFVRGLRKRSPNRALALRLPEFMRVLKFGLPNGVNWFLEFAAFALFINAVVAHLGTSVLAAFNVVIQINSISFMPAFGLASAGAILVGDAIGRGAHDDVKKIVVLTAKVASVFMGSVGLVYLLFSQWLMQLFAQGDGSSDELIKVGATMLALSALWQLFDALGLTLGEALRAAGDTAFCMLIRVSLGWLVFAPLGYALVFHLDAGVQGVIGAMIVYMALLAAGLSLRFLSGRWRDIDMVGEPAPL